MSIKNNDELFAQAVNEYEKSIVKILLYLMYVPRYCFPFL